MGQKKKKITSREIDPRWISKRKKEPAGQTQHPGDTGPADQDEKAAAGVLS